MKYYAFLAAAIGFELVAASALKVSDGMTKLLPAVICVICYILCYFFFGKALVGIDLAIAYATWGGVGIVATSLISRFFFHEQITGAGIAGIGLIVVGTLLLNTIGVKS